MKFLFFVSRTASPNDSTQSRLMWLAAGFLFILATILTLSPAVRAHTWDVIYLWQHWLGFLVWIILFSLLHNKTMQYLPERDPYLLPIGSLLSGWGLLTIWRISPSFGIRQTIWLLVAGLLFWVGLRIKTLPIFLRRYKYLWLLSGFVLMGLTFVFGTYPGGDLAGPHLWLGGLGGIYFQPSEPLKLLLIVYLAAYLADHIHIRFGLAQLFLPTLVLTVLSLLLLVAQRDLGTATLFLFFYATLLFIASDRIRVMVLSGVGISMAAFVGYISFDVVRLRVDAWIDPWIDASGRSYQIVQSLIAIASGNLIGRGIGIGSPILVPVAQSDFIFAAIAEESGLLGALGLILALGFLTIRGIRTALNATQTYQRYLAAGLTVYLIAQSVLIIAGNIRMLPLTGVTLPFVSYGGSSLVVSFTALLLLLQISNTPDQEPAWLSSPRPYFILGSFLLGSLLISGIITSLWSIVRFQELVDRGDNLRHYISDRYVPRGSILDRYGTVITTTTGAPGTYMRSHEYPHLSPLIGYTNPGFGQAGLEASLDPYLRGLQGYFTSYPQWHDLLYGQHPPGLDVRLSLDLNLQSLTDQLLNGHSGAVVLLNAKTGEILVMASHPTFNANDLENTWNDILNDPGSPLLNRTSQGQYPPGTALGPFLLAAGYLNDLPNIPEPLAYNLDNNRLRCSLSPNLPVSWGDAVSSGCPATLVHLAELLGEEQLLQLFEDLGFYETPQLPIQLARAAAPASFTRLDQAAVGQDTLTISPLQVALAAAALSGDGLRPAPRLVIAINKPGVGWTLEPNQGSPIRALPDDSADLAAHALADDSQLYWQSVGTGQSGPDQYVSWYLGGTLPDWKGTPLALALILEENNPELISNMGEHILQTATRP